MIEPREVSEAEATESRASGTRSVAFKPSQRRDLAWRLQLALVALYVVMWYAWDAAISSPLRSLFLWARRWCVEAQSMVRRSGRPS